MKPLRHLVPSLASTLLALGAHALPQEIALRPASDRPEVETKTPVGGAQVASGIHWADVDADGLADALVLQPDGRLRLLRNLGDGTLEELTGTSLLAEIEGARFVLFEDLDGDGLADLFVADTTSSRLLVSLGRTFLDVTEGSGLAAMSAVRSASSLDYDGDGRRDLFVVRDGRSELLHGLGDGAFEGVDLVLAGSGSADWLIPVQATPSSELEVTQGTAQTDSTSGTHLPVDLTLAGRGVQPGRAPDAARGTGSLFPDGVTSPLESGCVASVMDTATGACLAASSMPSQGLLFPYSGANNQFTGTSFVGGGSNNAATGTNSFIGAGSSNTAGGSSASIGGGSGNATGSVRATVGGGSGNRASNGFDTVGGGLSNEASGGDSTVGGGHTNRVTGDRASISGGHFNAVTGYGASVSGGYYNSASATAAAVGGGNLNSSLADGTTVAGGRSNFATGIRSSVSGGRINTAGGEASTVGGGSYNSAGALRATVAGGYLNTASGSTATIAGGEENDASGENATVAGGFDNDAAASGASVGGGAGNDAAAEGATIGGGVNNAVTSAKGTVAGGENNLISGVGLRTHATIGGGESNESSGSHGTVAGGFDNTAEATVATVSGGQLNMASGFGSVVAGGGSNEATATWATVAGGFENKATEFAATVAGGEKNEGTERFGFAAGRQAKANHEGAFVWGDSRPVDRTSSRDDEMNLHGLGGVRVFTRRNTTTPTLALGGSGTTNSGLELTTALLLRDPNTSTIRASIDAVEGEMQLRGERGSGEFLVRLQNDASDGHGINIRLGQSLPAEKNEFVRFESSQGEEFGKITGQTFSELLGSFDYTWTTAMKALDIAFIAAEGFACAAQLDAAEVIVMAAEGIDIGIQWGVETDQADKDVGVSYQSGSADYAEWLEKADPQAAFSYGDIVGVRAGRISLETSGTHELMVISKSPIVLGNMPPEGERDAYEMVAFLGQVPVKVEGSVERGDYILPSDRGDGMGLGVSPADMDLADYGRIVGVAWEATPAEAMFSYVNTAVGINSNDLLAQVQRRQAELESLKGNLNAIVGHLQARDPNFQAESFAVAPVAAPASEARADLAAALQAHAEQDPEQRRAEQIAMLREKRDFFAGIQSMARSNLQDQGVDFQKFEQTKRLLEDPDYLIELLAGHGR